MCLIPHGPMSFGNYNIASHFELAIGRFWPCAVLCVQLINQVLKYHKTSFDTKVSALLDLDLKISIAVDVGLMQLWPHFCPAFISSDYTVTWTGILMGDILCLVLSRKLPMLSDQERDLLIGRLKTLKFIKSQSDGELHAANEFFDAENHLFLLMLNREMFPPEPFDNYRWVSVISYLSATKSYFTHQNHCMESIWS